MPHHRRRWVRWREQPCWSKFPILLFPEDFQAVYLTFIQIWDAQHIAEILYLKYFYVVVYSDGR
jgi:hypothetical protein